MATSLDDLAHGWLDTPDGAHPFVRIIRTPYEEPYHLNLVVTASNGRVRGQLEIYVNAQDLGRVAKRLRDAPHAPGPVWELGSEKPDERFALYFCWRVLRLSPSGQCALALRFNNNSEPPRREITDFAIPVWPADLDRLAQRLERFGRLEHRVLWWTPLGGELRGEDTTRY